MLQYVVCFMGVMQILEEYEYNILMQYTLACVNEKLSNCLVLIIWNIDLIYTHLFVCGT